MVAPGGVGGRELYYTMKSVFIHRTTPLHFHFIADDRAKTILQAMLDTWLLPGVNHEYYDFHQVLETLKLANSLIQCSQVLSIHLNLHLILPEGVHSVVVIQPTSVVTVDLALLQYVSESRQNSTAVIACGAACVTHCSEGRGEYSKWGALSVNLQTSLIETTELFQTVERQGCSLGAVESVDEAVMEVAGRNPDTLMEEPCETVRKYDGELLRHRVVAKCGITTEPLVSSPPPGNDACRVFAWERAVQRREIPFLMGHSYSPRDEYDLSMATHLTYNRLDLLEKTLSHWDGPASVGIYVSETDVDGVFDFLQNSKTLRERDDITYHLVFKIGPSYAPNHMREIGHRYVSTPYIFFLDGDFVPSPGLYRTLREKLRNRAFGDISKTAVVIPAFEADDENFQIPSSKAVMLKLFLNNTVRQFHKVAYEPGHKNTNYRKWMVAKEPYYVQWNDRYEPYYILHSSVFSFDHRFVARFLNKVSHAQELHMAGYKFLIFPDGFVVHLPHSRNKQNMVELRKCDHQWYNDWIKEKRKLYNYTNTDIRDYI